LILISLWICARPVNAREAHSVVPQGPHHRGRAAPHHRVKL
jgi:hypothetical protein